VSWRLHSKKLPEDTEQLLEQQLETLPRGKPRENQQIGAVPIEIETSEKKAKK